MIEKEITLKNFDVVLEGEIKVFGNGAHIVVPKEHAGKKATIIIENKK